MLSLFRSSQSRALWQGQWCVCRAIERFQILSWNPGLWRGGDAGAVDNHICGPWYVTCLPDGADVANHPTLHHRFHVVPAHHCAVLFNKDTFEGDIPTKPILDGGGRAIQEACWWWLLPHHDPDCAHQQRMCKPTLRAHQLSPLRPHPPRPGRCDAAQWRLDKKDATRGKHAAPSPLEAAFSHAPALRPSIGNSPLLGPEEGRGGRREAWNGRSVAALSNRRSLPAIGSSRCAAALTSTQSLNSVFALSMFVMRTPKATDVTRNLRRRESRFVCPTCIPIR